MVVRVSDKKQTYNNVTKLLVKPNKLIIVKLNNYYADCFQNNLQKIFSESGHNIEDVVLFK